MSDKAARVRRLPRWRPIHLDRVPVAPGLRAYATVHSEIAAVPAERLTREAAVLRGLPGLRAALQRGESRKVDRLATVRYGSARYSVPARLVGATVWVSVAGEQVLIDHGADRFAEHPLVAPGEVSIIDAHYGGARGEPRRAVRARTATEKAFLALGPVAEAFLRAAAAAGQSRLPAHLADIAALEATHGREVLIAALERALTFRRFTAEDVARSWRLGPTRPRSPRPAPRWTPGCRRRLHQGAQEATSGEFQLAIESGRRWAPLLNTGLFVAYHL